MRSVLAGLVGIALLAPQASAAEVVFGNDVNAAKALAARTGQAVMVLVLDGSYTTLAKWKFNTFRSDPVVEASRRFIPVLLPGGGQAAREMGVSDILGFRFLNAKGDVLEKVDGYYATDPATLASDLNRIADRHEAAMLPGFKNEALTGKGQIALRGAAILGQMKIPESIDALAEIARSEEAFEGARKTAIEGLARRKCHAEDLVPLLAHKSSNLRTAASSALAAIGAPAGAPLLDGLASEDADMRVACHRLAAQVTRYPKSGTSTFWKTGSADERAAALEAWRVWCEKNRPAEPNGVRS